MSEYTEKQIIEQALPIIDSWGRISTSELVEELVVVMNPSGRDLDILDGRNDTRFSQKVRNIKSHSDNNNIEIFVDIDEQGYFSSKKKHLTIDETDDKIGEFRIDLSFIEEGKEKFAGRKTDFSEVNKRNKDYGDAGELLVMEDQRKILKSQNNPKASYISHIAHTKGDGFGYDVLSFNPEGENVYIEVKTTTGGLERQFHMSINELLFLQKNVEWYIIARVYNYDENKGTADIKYYSGRELYKKATFTPSNFKVKVEN